ncbi:MAG: hypothetical protein J6I66_09200 [Lachnospiraceae bacterium]|nr:hypothetical protein [Lachnospiraceae bacterium]
MDEIRGKKCGNLSHVFEFPNAEKIGNLHSFQVKKFYIFFPLKPRGNVLKWSYASKAIAIPKGAGHE